MATTAGERLLFLLLNRHDEWRILAEILQDASLLMGRRYGDLPAIRRKFATLQRTSLQRWTHNFRGGVGQYQL